ncbi:hypothetical protein EHQ27_03100 [Leptospira wolffii]|uniref:hypothetical protein n=1 Tax=Leptospira wolffii TaxID=409998 RepID=UPI001084920B|nr:hypothetical protein [Leptospira wolffii]TGK64858.1 hypothetical protein EHQ32_01170 [Leptospira wolffii]TGK76743.1 hypothetical protein EHQ35_00045 [Leptospira wolffii]TGK77405.1 hypothetical protein EHQ27_03100 [Leptospira wolffii]TGL26800.1 hypothetical protein EHQ57_19005 [Leptospira wolffii]
MKKLVIVLIGLLSLRCVSYGKVKAWKDDFKNQTTFNLELYANTKFTPKGARTLFLSLTKTVSEGSKTVIKCYLFAKLSDHDQPFANSLFFKLGDKKINIESQDAKNASGGDRFSVWRSYSAEFILTNELQNDLLNANSLSIRFYSGEFPYDADFSSNDLQAIKELIRSKP